MEVLRLACYLAGLLMACVMAFQLFRLKHGLARLLAGMMFAWALNCGTLAVMLYLKLDGVEWSAQASQPIWTINAAILCVAPILLYIWFLRQNGSLKNDS